MEFADRLKEKRLEANLTQAELAKITGLTSRAIQHYELGSRTPRNIEIVGRLAEALDTSVEYLLGKSGGYVVAAAEKEGPKAARELDEMVNEIAAQFAGGELSEEAMDGVMAAMNRAYWLAKENNKKYTPKKYRKDE